LVVSPVTVALTVAVLPTARVAGGNDSATETIVAVVIVTDAVSLVVPSLAEVAEIVTAPPVGAVAGAVYFVAMLLLVATGLKLPQLPTGLQLQVTPFNWVSLATIAVKLAVPDGATE
jgi:hypothetical protein